MNSDWTNDVDWARGAYRVRVRAKSYLWGSEGISQDLTFARPLVLHLLNDAFGEEITVATRVAAGTTTTLGTLQPGEAVSIPVQGLAGVFASCALESAVSCLIR